MMNSSKSPLSPIDQGPGAVALLERRAGMSGDLFSRYWRDVHGVLATRIPGFSGYRQYHVDRVPIYRDGAATAAMEIDGIAEVSFAQTQSEGLVSSRVAELIRSDEQNVFSRAVLYSLPGGASQIGLEEAYDRNEHLHPTAGRLMFLLFRGGAEKLTAVDLWAQLDVLGRAAPGVRFLHSHLLSAGDRSWWNTPGVHNDAGGEAFVAAVKLELDGDSQQHIDPLLAALKKRREAALAATLYRVTHRFVMVHEGAPTEIGLRGLDAFRTIGEANALNQRSEELLRCLYRYP